MAEYNRSGVVFEPSNISVADYLDYWFDTYGKMNLKYNMQIGYLNIIENHLKPRLGHYRLAALQSVTIQEYANELKLNGLSKSSVVGIITTLSGALNYAIEPLHYIQANPCSMIHYSKYERDTKADKRYIISPEEFRQIIERFPPSSQYYLPLVIGYYTGLRISETFALTWNDVDMELRTLSVNKITVKRNAVSMSEKCWNKKERKKKNPHGTLGVQKPILPISPSNLVRHYIRLCPRQRNA